MQIQVGILPMIVGDLAHGVVRVHGIVGVLHGEVVEALVLQ